MAYERCICGKHVYDTSRHSSCPYCAELSSSSDAASNQNQGGSEKNMGIGNARKTRIVGYEEVAQLDNDVLPVVAWLVVEKGKGQGLDKRITSGMNKIGRARDNDVCLDMGDDSISSKHALIAYDPEDKIFMIQNWEGRNPPKVNGKMVMSSQILQAHDKIRLGNTILRFVPLCGEHFGWG